MFILRSSSSTCVLLCISLSLGAGCDKKAASNAATTQKTAPTGQEALSKNALSESKVEFKKGDWVKLVYTGSFTDSPVEVVQRILRIEQGTKNKKRVVTGVQIKKGDKHNKFLLVSDGSFKSRQSGLPDEIVEFDASGNEVKLDKVTEVDLYRLWQWTLPKGIGGQPRNMKSSIVDVIIGKTTFNCKEESGESSMGDKTVKISFRHCNDFVWFKAPSEVKLEDGTVLWQADVVAFGSAADFPSVDAAQKAP